MRIGILTTTGDKQENHELVQAAHERGHDAKLLHHLKCSFRVCPNSPEVYYEGNIISNEFDIIIPRIDLPKPNYGLSILRQFEAMKIFTSEKVRAIKIARDKLRSTQHLLRANVPFPSTGFAYSKEDFNNIINTVGGVPLIIKLSEGTEGDGVFLAEDMKHAVNLLKTFKQFTKPLIVQKFIAESAGQDIRAFVAGGKVIAAMQRRATDDDFRANISQGGIGSIIELTDLEKAIAIRAAQAIGINVAGVDLIRSNEGTLLLEINASMDFLGDYGLTKITGIDVAGEIIDYAVGAKKESMIQEHPLLKKAG